MASKAIKRFNIFFDTNTLENRFGKEQKGKYFLKYDEFKLPGDYYKILDFIIQNKLIDDVQLCIPEVVWREIIQHMREDYFAKKQSAIDVIANYNKAFGELAEINFSFKIDNPDDYEKHLSLISKKFWEEDNKECRKISHPKSKAIVEKLMDKAFRKEKPFVEAKATNGGKFYSDAGLKDALIIETMLYYCDKKDAIGILFSKDTDFSDIFVGDIKEKFKVFNSVDKVIDYLEIQNNLNKEKLVRFAFENNVYLKESVVDASGNTYDISVTDFDVQDVKASDDDGIFIVTIFATINEAEYLFEVKYDLEANEILDSSSKIENE